MAVNKVIYGDTTLIDLTSDTIAADKILQGYTAHDKSGAFITGTYSSKNATITVTYSKDFYGTTITATNGTTTLTKTATSSGELVFNVSEGGTWIVSGVVEGSTYSEQVDVTFEYTTPQLIALPNGSTATPVNSIPIWLKCAGIRDKDYTTLSQVLADTETLIALCADSNACDYMARSTNWASGVAADSTAMLIVGKYNYCAKALLGNSTWASAIANSTYFECVCDAVVPKLSSNTASVLYSTQYDTSSYPAYKAFDRTPPSQNSQWLPTNGATNNYIGYDFGTDKSFARVYVDLYYGPASGQTVPALTFKVQGYTNDAWSDIDEFTIEATSETKHVTKGVDISLSNTYSKMRLFCATALITSAYGVGVNTLQFYGRTDNANYIPLVPKMTSATTPSGQVTASGEYSSVGRYAWKAFDGSASGDIDQWQVTNTTSGWIAYKFPQAILANVVRIKPSPSSYGSRIKDFQIIGSNDDFVTTDTLYSGTMPNEYANVTWHTYTFTDNVVAYRSYKVNVLNTYDTQSNIGAYEIQFYRKSDLPIIHSAVEDSIFYMDDGSPVALCGIPVGDTIDVDLEAYKGQTLTLVSTVAKDPTNLSNDFTMPVRITPNITEIYLMPVKELYWWGHQSSNLEDMTNANGWISWGSSNTYESPTYNKNNIDLKPSASDKVRGVASKNKIPIDKLYGIATTGGASTYGRISTIGQKTSWSGQVDVTFANTGISKYTLNDTDQADRYAFSINLINTSLAVNLNALWYE